MIHYTIDVLSFTEDRGLVSPDLAAPDVSQHANCRKWG